jgi:3-methyladenine DNA glycosylase/8-oxoguanine DNA glycosylase
MILKPQECGFAQRGKHINTAVSVIVLRQANVLYQQLQIDKQYWREQQTVLRRTRAGHAADRSPPSSYDNMKPLPFLSFLLRL